MDQQECVRVDSGTGVTQKLSTDFIRVVPQTSRNQFAGNRTWVRIPPSPPELAVTSHCQLFLYRLLCTIFGTASGHTIHCICRSLLRVVIQVSVDVCCIRIGTMSQPYLDLFHCDIFTAVKQMPCPLSVQFFILVRIQSSSLLQQRKP